MRSVTDVVANVVGAALKRDPASRLPASLLGDFRPDSKLILGQRYTPPKNPMNNAVHPMV